MFDELVKFRVNLITHPLFEEKNLSQPSHLVENHLPRKCTNFNLANNFINENKYFSLIARNSPLLIALEV